MPHYRIGVDVGGTNTDAALLNVNDTDPRVYASTKTPTTPDITAGISTAIENVLAESRVDNRDDVLSVAIGTTHFINAVVQADATRLSRVAVVRLCGPFTRMVPPFAEFPPKLREIMQGPVFYLDGGLEIDGREIAPLDPEQIKATVKSIQEAGVRTVAVVGVFSAVDYDGIHEESCRKQMLQLEPSLSVVCSNTVGGIGLLERENASILNASILGLARKTIVAFRKAMAQMKLKCTLYLTQNDGTLTDATSAANLPIKTFSSGPTNSVIGAAFLAKQHQAQSATQVLVMDIGGTTSDVCALLPNGFPRPAPNFVDVGGVKTAFSMPEVLSIGLGGGSIVTIDSDTVRVGPESVGHEITRKALVFGGDVMTATDIVVACGKADIGDKSKVAHIPEEVITNARDCIRKMLEQAVDKMKISEQPLTLLLVGGGTIIQMDPLCGVAECIIPPHYGSANAVGAAIAKVIGEVDIIVMLANSEGGEDEAVEDAKQRAIAKAVARGADPSDVKIAEITKIPLSYVTGKATRLVVKAVGKLASRGSAEQTADTTVDQHTNDEATDLQIGLNKAIKFDSYSVTPSSDINIETYRPDVRNHVWYLTPVDLEFIATGTGVLGTGGGGPSRLQYLQCLDILHKSPGKMRVVSLSSLNDSDVCVSGSWYGAPSVAGERLPAGNELALAMEACVKISGKVDAHVAVTGEIGGGNGLSVFPVGVEHGIPVADGDMMGRAYPTMAHCLPFIYGANPLPFALADGRGNTAVVTNAQSTRRIETMIRVLCEDLGSQAGASSAPFSGDVIKQYTVPNTISQSWYIGRAIHSARQSKKDLIQAIFDVNPGKLLYNGKIVDVKRDVSRGYTMGTCTIAPVGNDEREASLSSTDDRYLVVPFQNEYLYAAYADGDDLHDVSKQTVICTVPDLVSILGQDGEALGSQDLRYGLQVYVIGMAAHPLWRTEKAMKVGGPEGFKLQMEWTQVGEYQPPLGVVDEFNSD
ncbi:hydantoinase/oxoprolinase [Aspergillus terreus]|uniref:Hydantoinase/oxoprolinase n=1 Tax=Aspergillus terreus TaxID=33178 RepID=A0A5M3YVW0_ASPTE|nr:hypothetical protein ATETN484_0004081700 [Aspergillus terreus]GFF13885.1 hydantoinase/oxoprolinase [Aspergillus terreus]